MILARVPVTRRVTCVAALADDRMALQAAGPAANREEGAVSEDAMGALREPPVRSIESVNGAVVVHLRGELDLYNADEVRHALADVASQRPDRVVVDLTEVEFVDSTALGVFVEARAKLENREAFLLAAPGAEARRALEVSGLERHFGIHETVDAARSAQLD
jgi:anti-sigma B factor antagonist